MLVWSHDEKDFFHIACGNGCRLEDFEQFRSKAQVCSHFQWRVLVPYKTNGIPWVLPPVRGFRSMNAPGSCAFRWYFLVASPWRRKIHCVVIETSRIRPVAYLEVKVLFFPWPLPSVSIKAEECRTESLGIPREALIPGLSQLISIVSELLELSSGWYAGPRIQAVHVGWPSEMLLLNVVHLETGRYLLMFGYHSLY